MYLQSLDITMVLPIRIDPTHKCHAGEEVEEGKREGPHTKEIRLDGGKDEDLFWLLERREGRKVG